MSRILAGGAALALLFMLALPDPATAAEPRADGLRSNDANVTEMSARHRRWHRRVVVVRRPFVRRAAVWGPGWGPGYAATWGYPYAHPYAYPYYWRPRPVVAFSVGPAWGWGPGWGWGRRGWW